MKKGGTRSVVSGEPRSSIKTACSHQYRTAQAHHCNEVEAHNRSVCQRGSSRICCRGSCGRCGQPGPFAPHEVRRRTLRLIVDYSVLCVAVWLARWRCRRCRYVFTDYPDFRTPYKRYAGPTLLHLAASYVENDKASYRETASPKGRRRTYQSPLVPRHGQARVARSQHDLADADVDGFAVGCLDHRAAVGSRPQP